jgi:hypothetical protein
VLIVAWYDNPINDLFNKLVGYVNSDIEGIVEYLASFIGPMDEMKTRLIGITSLIIITVLVVHNRAKIFARRKPTRFKELWECFLKGDDDD